MFDVGASADYRGALSFQMSSNVPVADPDLQSSFLLHRSVPGGRSLHLKRVGHLVERRSL
jgi:hypothetical protein